MDTSYYSFDGKVKERSMFLETVNNEESKVCFMGKDGEIINTSLVLENWEAYDYMYKSVYYLYLFDRCYADLIKNKEIDHIFTDKDYKIVLASSGPSFIVYTK